ncbi:MAG TPA: ATP-binding protein [Nitrospirota bacterium]|nr:ATP-binding protein [Nitrospirota bacterium]
MTGQTLLILLPGVLTVIIAAIAIWSFMRRYRRELGVAKEQREKTTDTSFIINAFHEVTKQLKEKEKELERLKSIAEQHAENIESYNENILQCVTSGVMTFDAECRLTTINRAAEETLSLGKDDVTGKTCLELFGNNEISRAVRNTLEGHVPSARMEDRLERSGGGLWLGFNTAVLADRQNEVIGVILSFTDLTEVKRLQAQMELRERLTALGEMSAGIAHELRNPMAVISGYLNLLSKKTDQAGQEVTRKIAEEISGMNRIIGDLLTFARPASLNRARVNVKELLEGCLASARQAVAPDQPFETKVRIEEIEASVDEVLMRQAFTNLIQNALEAMPGGGMVFLEAGVRNDELVVVIRDTGMGIPPAIVKKIFLPFYTTKDKGVGMGLALAHKVITSHGGRIEVESKEGRGTTFTVMLPRG